MHQENGPQDPPNPAKTWQSTQYANIVLHAPSEIYYARLRVKGKLLWRSLKTNKISIAKLRLGDLEKEERKKSEAGFVQVKDKILVSDCLAAYRQKGFRPAKPRHKQDVRPLKPAAIFYYEQQVKVLLKTWPGLEHLEVRHLTEKDCADWAGRARQGMAPSVFNHTLGILRNLFEFGIQAGARYHNPALGVMRESERPKHLVLPDEETFGRFVAEIEAGQSRLSRDCANLVRFMAYGGLRRTEAAYVKGADCDFERGIITLRGHPVTGLKNRPAGETRPVPMIPQMREFLGALKKERGAGWASAYVMRVRSCQRAINRAVKAIGMARITHHDLRHLFATRCIESGVDIPTVSRWLGHRDGGALAMKVYGHLRDHHSAAMAEKVTFAKTPQPSPAVPPSPEGVPAPGDSPAA